MQAVQNLGMAVVTMMAGRIVDDQGYLVLEVFFLAWLCRKYFSSFMLSISKSVCIFVIYSIAGGYGFDLGDEREPWRSSQHVCSGKR